MCVSGAQTGTAATVRVRRPTLRDRRQALAASFVVVIVATARGTAVSRIVATTTLTTVTTTAVCASSSFLRIRGEVNSQRSTVNWVGNNCSKLKAQTSHLYLNF